MKACIFDLDGTLADTLESLTYSVTETLKEMGLPGISADECRSFVGNGARVLMERSLQAAKERRPERLEEGMRIYGRIFDANCTYHVTSYQGVPEVLEELKRKGIKLAVLSNKPHLQTVKVVKEIFGEDMFRFVQGQQDQIARKPDPAGVHQLMRQMHVKPEECLYIGDSEVDIRTGENAKVRVISVSWGFRTREALAAAGAGTVIERPGELLKFVQ